MPRLGITAGLVLLVWLSAAAEPLKPNQFTDPYIIVAQQEMLNLANAEQVCGAETTYFVALEALNDLSAEFLLRPYDYINWGDGSYAIRPVEGRFRTGRIDLLTGYNVWKGPYLTYQAGRYQTGVTPYDQGSPLDPWGTPYYFFTPLGLARGDTGVLTLEFYGDAFERYTIVSLGPDGVMSGDDMAYSFGTGVSTLALTSVRGSGVGFNPSAPTLFTAPAGATLTLRGRNLGTAPADGKIFFGATQVGPALAWTNTAIQVNLPRALAGQTAALTVRRGSVNSNSLALRLTGSANAAAEWALYD